MKTSKSGSVYLKKVKKNIILLLKKPSGNYESEDYHKLRVEIKKLKAAVSFIKFTHQSFSKRKVLKPFEKIYHQAGAIRELQLEATYLQKDHPEFIEKYLLDLAGRIDKEKKRFALLLTKNPLPRIKAAIKRMKPYLEHSSQTDSNQFIRHERKRIARLTRQLPMKPSKVHKLRKLLKKDFYNRKRCDGPSRNIKAEDDFLQLLGRWHDCVILNNQLGTSVLQAEIDPAELAELLKIKAAASAKSENLFSQINEALQKGIF